MVGVVEYFVLFAEFEGWGGIGVEGMEIMYYGWELGERE